MVREVQLLVFAGQNSSYLANQLMRLSPPGSHIGLGNGLHREATRQTANPRRRGFLGVTINRVGMTLREGIYAGQQ